MNVKQLKSKQLSINNHLPKQPQPRIITRNQSRKLKFNANIKDEQKHIETQQQTKDIQIQHQRQPRQNNPVDQYTNQIFQRIIQDEYNFSIDNSYLKHHKVLNKKIRVFLVKYVYKMCIKYSLKRTTIFLCVYYMDYYFQNNINLTQENLFNVSQAALLIAMKYEQIYPPQLNSWVSNKSRQQVIKYQAQILKTIDFKLGYFTIQNFYQYQKDLRKLTEKQESLAIFLLDLILFDEKMYQYKPSLLIQSIMKVIFKEQQKDNRILDNIKWMIQRNSNVIQWLFQTSFYVSHKQNIFKSTYLNYINIQ